MKELSGSAEITTEATPRACFELVAAVDRYPAWDPDVIPSVEVLAVDSDGRTKRVRTAVHVAVGPITRDFDLVMDVQLSEKDAVCLSRVPNEAGDPERFEVVWRIAERAPTRLRIELTATLEVPRLVPVGGIGDRLAQQFVEAARRELEGSSAKASASSS
jgi:ribosome-associated toxin RatA of RatAB toxin-antitoxin module